GTATALLTYISDTKWGAKIYGADCSPITNDGDYVQIINFDVTGSCVQGITTNGNYTKIIGNRVHDMTGTQLTAAIVVDCCSYTKTGNQVIGNVVDNIGPWGQVNQTHGIYLAGPGNTAMNNIVTRAASACIQTYHGATRLTIANNVLANCGKYGIQLSADPAVTVNDYTTVDNNIIVNGGQYGIHEAYSLGSHIVYNNNIVYNNPAGNISGSTGIQSGTITLTSAQFSALFVNYTGDMTGDYHLRSGAVAIDAGTTLCAAGVVVCVPALDFTDPQPSRIPLTQVVTSLDLTPLPVASVSASGDDGNIPQNTLDNNLATRWSASGDRQWIRYDLGAVMAIGAVNIAWYRGTEWASAFDIEVSLDSLTWTRAFTGRSSGQTLQPERYDFPTVPGRYVRVVGHGQWSDTTQLSLWNSITETVIYGSAAAPVNPVPVASVVASGDDGNIPQNTLDNNLATRWSASGDGQWIRYDLGAVMAIGPVNIAWHRGTEWASAFDIEVSLDSLTWARAFTGRSSGLTLQPERYDFPVVPGRYVRVVGHGQWSGTTQLSLWNSITETAIYG